MKRSKFSEEQIAYALRQAESGTPVEAPETGFHVRHWYAQLGGGEGRGQGRVEIAEHKDQIGTHFLHNRLYPLDDLGDLSRARSLVDPQIEVGLADMQLGEELVRHGLAVVWPGVNEDRPYLRLALHFGDQRSDSQQGGTRDPTTVRIFGVRIVSSLAATLSPCGR